ncbi:helix-hairpin-helix domain-containing protein [Neobacillus vireti]|uniref:helix-hairpin-helix domain-containing protein n=1 Tax=Neobacillus vireti TaxID=220686 RepID=UPI0030001FAE
MKDWIIEHKKYVMIAAVIAFAAIFYFLEESKSSVSNLENIVPQSITEEKETELSPEQITEPQSIIVDVKGQVKMPGVYSSAEGERVIDVINRAGGLTENGDESQVNFAEHVQDAMVIYIPAKGEEGIAGDGGTAGSVMNTGGDKQAKINLNKADENELQNLPGIGPSKAAAILEYRETNGVFKSVEDLKNISGIGDKTFEKLKDLITVK